MTYVPHLGTDLPKYYVGSKKCYDKTPRYRGSPSSQQVFSYTEGKTLAEWWRDKVRESPDDFVIESLEETELDPGELVLLEKSWQERLDVLSTEYFNQALATKGFYAKSNGETTKALKAEKTREYWSSPEGMEKRRRMSERNRAIKSAQMREKWQNPTPEMLEGLQKMRRNRIAPAGEEWHKKFANRKKRTERRVTGDGVRYENAKIAAEKLGVTVQTIRRRCADADNTAWSYE